MEPKGCIKYTKRGISCELSSFGHEQYPFNRPNQKIEPMVFADYPKQGIYFFIGFGMVMQYPSMFL